MDILEKIRSQPERIRKIILWVVVITIGLGLLTWWVKNFHQRLKSFKAEQFKKQLKIPSLKEELEKMPKIEMPKLEIPEISEEEFEKLKEEIEKREPEK